YEEGGAQMVRVCDGKTLPKGDASKTYMLRVFGGRAHEIWDVTDPAKPALLTKIVEGLKDTHKSSWECDTGIAYLVSGVAGWRVRRGDKAHDPVLRPQRSIKAGSYPRLRPHWTGARFRRRGADRAARADLDRTAGQSRVFRLRHQQGRRAADRRPRKASQRS